MAILIVEDEAYRARSGSGCRAGGRDSDWSLATTEEALEIIASALAVNTPIMAAILDANLVDRDGTPVVLRLLACGVPMVLHSATGFPAEISTFDAQIPWVPKPARTGAVVASLTEQLELAGRHPSNH